MAKNTIGDLSTTSASNTDVLGQSIAGSAAANTLDTINQNELALLARWYGDTGGLGAVGGSANAITLTSLSTYQSLSNGLQVTFKASAINTAAVTLNLDGLGVKAIRLQGDTALVGGEILLGGTYQLRYDTAYNTAAGAWVLLNSSLPSGTVTVALGGTGGGAAPVALSNLAAGSNATFSNLGILASVASNALTVAIKGEDGNDPSATNPVVLTFRNATLTTGTPTRISLTAATSLVISSGSTMGFANSTPGRLWLVGFYDAGTLRPGLINCLSNNSITPLRNGFRASSTAEGGAGAADSAGVFYTGTAVSSKDYIVLASLDWDSGLVTAGAWATAPTTVRLHYAGQSLPGDVVQIRRTDTGAFASGGTQIPSDDTIPTNTEGDQYMSQAITCQSTMNAAHVRARAYATNGGTVPTMIMALYQDSGAAIAVGSETLAGNNDQVLLDLDYLGRVGTVSATTFKARIGASVSGTTSFNGSGSRKFGGVYNSYIEVSEIIA